MAFEWSIIGYGATIDRARLVRALAIAFGLIIAAVFPNRASAQTSPTTTVSSPGAWSYTVPAGVYFVSVRAAGAGGGGGGADLGGSGGAGGAGTAITVMLRVTPGQVLSGTIGGGGRSGFTGGPDLGGSIACSGAGLASSFGGGGRGANANCAVGGYSGGGGAGGGGTSVALAGTIVAQAGGGGGGSGGGWYHPGVNGVAAAASILQTSACGAVGSGAAGVSLALDGGAAGGGGGGYPGGTAGAGSNDDGGQTGSTAATGGGTARGGGAGGSCANTTAAILSAVASGTGGAGAAGEVNPSGTSSGVVGGNGSITITLLPSVIVAKTTTGGTGTFNFTGTNGFANQAVTTSVAGTPVAGSPQLLTSPASATTLTETGPTGFILSGITCTGLGSGGTATVNLTTRSVTLNAAAISPGTAVTCTFTNAIAPTITKVSTVVWDPTNGITNPRAIPGAQVRYCIVVSSNSGGAVMTAPTVSDRLPSTVTFVPGSLFVNGTASGTVCNTGAVTYLGHPTNGTGTGASGTTGGSFSAGTVTATLSTIASGARATVYFDVIVN